MENSTTSFWIEIKKYEDTLAADPTSYCFAPLAELYRRIGLLDDALAVAVKGSERHPEYVGGHLALGRVYFDKGMMADARRAMEQVIKFTPDNLLAQRILGQIYVEIGETTLARNAFETILAANPDDAECQIMLESLQRTSELSQQPFADELDTVWNVALSTDGQGVETSEYEDDDYEIELTDVIEDEELPGILMSDMENTQRFEATHGASTVVAGSEEAAVGIRTATLAELYVSQGYQDRAIEIYQELVAEEPQNAAYISRLTELGGGQSPSVGFGETIAQPWGVPNQKKSAIAGLEELLENIRRVRACRSERA